MKEFLAFVKRNSLGKCLENESLKKYTTYKAGGTAKVIFYPKNIRSLTSAVQYLREHKIRHLVLGYGSNVLFSDDTYEGVIIKLDEFNKITFFKNKIRVGAGYSLMRLARDAAKRGLTGLEFAAGIPGSVGGAIYMNAGAYRSDMGYITTKVKVLTSEYQVITMVNKELDFHYRKSFFQTHKDYIVLEATIALTEGKKEAILAVMEDRKKRRLESQPLEYPSAGSVFRNPPDVPAGKLIDDLHLKGLQKGDAAVSSKHANFIINLGSAKASDIRDLILFVHDTVEENYGYDLKIEQEFINWENLDEDNEKEKEDNQN